MCKLVDRGFTISIQSSRTWWWYHSRKNLTRFRIVYLQPHCYIFYYILQVHIGRAIKVNANNTYFALCVLVYLLYAFGSDILRNVTEKQFFSCLIQTIVINAIGAPSVHDHRIWIFKNFITKTSFKHAVRKQFICESKLFATFSTMSLLMCHIIYLLKSDNNSKFIQ